MEKLMLDDFLDYKYLSGLELSPDKKYGAFVLHTADFEGNSYNSQIWIFNCKTNEYKRLTNQNKEKSFIWLNNDTILFPSVRDEKLKNKIDKGENWTVYYAININGGEAYEYMRIPVKAESIDKISENKFIITAIYDNNDIDLNCLTGKEKEKAAELKEENKDYEVLDEIPFWSNGTGFTNKKRERIYFYDKITGNMDPISGKYENISVSAVNNGTVLYISEKFTDKQKQTTGLYLYDSENNKLKCLVDDDKYNIEFAEFLGDLIIFCGSPMDKYGLNQNPDFYIIQSNSIELLCSHGYSACNSVGSDCRYGSGKSYRVLNNSLYFIDTEAKSSFIKKLTSDGKIEKLSSDNGSVDCFDITDDTIYFIGLRGLKLQELYSLKSKKEIQITDFNEGITDSKNIIAPETVRFENDGIELDGFILKPVDYDENRSYPGILDIHGGPKTVYGEIFFHEMQYWANEGYFVFFCNPRGSDGRGDEFADIRGKYGTIDYDDLMKFTDLVLEKYPQIDSSRIGVTGGSYGGFMTNWIIGHTDRFKCAASQRSISNWLSKFGTTDIGYYFNKDQINATPWDNYEKMWSHSPLKYADKAVTPTLFIHSEEDYRCWLAEGLQMFTALKYHGVDARLCMFRGENHELSRSGKPKHRIRRLKEITEWFDKYLKKK